MNQKRQVLLVEDDPQLGQIYKEILELNPCQVTWLQDGLAAQQYLVEKIPDLIILDLHLPTISGEALLVEIQANDRLAKSKVVVISADGLVVDKIRPKVDLALLKPIEYSQLISLCMDV